VVQFSRAFVAPVAAVMLLSATQAAEFIPLGDLPGGNFSSSATGVSDDGTVVVGNGSPASGGGAFRWTAATGMVGLGDLQGGNYCPSAPVTRAQMAVFLVRTFGL